MLEARRIRWITLSLLALLTAAGCQVVAKLESRTADPLVTGCALPAADTGARIRVANLVPEASAVDFCVRPHGGAFARPVLRGAGMDCANGFQYEQISAAFGVPLGAIDVKTIHAGETCAAGALSEIDGLDVGADAVVTVARFGGNGVAEQLTALPESTGVDALTTKLRFVNAIPGSAPLYIGLTRDARLPTDVQTRLLLSAVPFGSTPAFGQKAAAGTIDEHGYLAIAPNAYAMGAAAEGDTKALLEAAIPARPASYTLFAIGNPSDNSFPTRGLFCEDNAAEGVTAKCSETYLSTLSVDVVNVGLYGANAPDENGRRPYITQALAKRDADLVCVVEAARKSDRDAIAAGVAATFPYASTATTDASTPFTNPANQSGDIPKSAIAPACSTVATAQIADIYQCMIDRCSKNDDAGDIIQGTTDCISTYCGNTLLPLFAGTTEEKRCFDCILDNVASDATYADGKAACTTDAHAPLAFHGENPSMILSRYPLVSTDVLVLPSTNFRRTVLYAQVELQKGSPNGTVDFFCGQLSSTLIDSDLPYVGDYGEGDPAHGYDHEQLLQTAQLIDWVKKKSGDRPAIIAGDWHASAAVAQNGTTLIDDVNPDTIGRLRGAFTEATAATWTPTCTYCPRSINPYNGDFKAGYAFSSVYLSHWPDKATTDEAILFNQPMVPAAGGTEMLSPSFGFNVRVLRP